jgi:mycobactin phenyloxazoline synthetase
VFNQRTVAGIARRFTELEESPGRLEAVAEIWLMVEGMSEDEVDERLATS